MIKKLSALIFTLSISIVAVIAQTTETVCSDFETPDDISSWTLINGEETNQWVFGTAVNDGTALYISDSPSAATPPNSYTSRATTVWAYRDYQFPTCNNDFTLSFDWRCYGETTDGNIDLMWVYFGSPVDVTAGTSSVSGLARLTDANGEVIRFNRQSTWQHFEGTLPIDEYSGQTIRLYFLWKNDGQDDGTFPAAVDNICLKSTCSTSCTPPVVDVTPASPLVCIGESVTLTATVTGGSASDYTFSWSPDETLSSTITDTTTATPTTTTTYTVRVAERDNDNCSSTEQVRVRVQNCAQNLLCNGFETPEERSRWNIVNGSQTNKWVIDTAISNEGRYALYITHTPSATPPPNSYYVSPASSVWAYMDIEFPDCDEDFVLSFDWRCGGESDQDYIKVCLGDPATVTAGSTTQPANSGYIPNTEHSGNYQQYFNTYPNYNDGSWHHAERTLSAANWANQTKRLYFLWHNNDSGGNGPAPSVDNICLQACTPCERPNVNVTPTSPVICPGESVTFTASASGGSGSGYIYTWWPENNPDDTTEATSLTVTPQVTTNYKLRVEDSEGCSRTVNVTAQISSATLKVTANPAGRCIEQSQTITVTATVTSPGSCSYSYQWESGETGSTLHVSPDVTTTYTVTATPADPTNCCELVSSVTVTVLDCSASGCPSLSPAELGSNNAEVNIDCASQDAGVTLCANVTATPATVDDYFVVQIPYNPPFGFTQGTRIFTNAEDDTWSSPTTLPFPFCFYGNTYSKVEAGANAVASFNMYSGNCDWLVASLPNSSIKNAIFIAYRDINPNPASSPINPVNYYGGSIHEGVLGEYPCRSYVLSYNNIALYDELGNASFLESLSWTGGCTATEHSFSTMLVLHEGTNIIDIYIRDAPSCPHYENGKHIGIVGIQDNGSRSLTAPNRNGGGWTAHNEAWRFVPTGQTEYDVTWYLGTDTSSTTGTILGTGDIIHVTPDESTYYTARLQYTACNGDYFDVVNTCHVVVNNYTSDMHVRASDDLICPQDEVTIQAVTTDAVSYAWNTGQTTASFTTVPTDTVTTYVCTTTYSNGCTRVDSVTVRVASALEPPTFVVEPAEICLGESSTLSTELEYSHYQWSTGSHNPAITVAPRGTTTYSLTVTDEIGCKADAETEVVVHPVPVATFMPEQYLTYLDDGEANVHFIDYSAEAENYLWNFGDPTSPSNYSTEMSPDHIYTSPGIYNVWLHVSTNFGCADSISHEVSIQRPFYFYVPNSFSPDGNGVNEVWKPVGSGVMEDDYECTVYDRWGRVVFHSTSMYQSWDGTEKGKPLPAGSYVYFIRTYTMERVPKEFLGTVTILR